MKRYDTYIEIKSKQTGVVSRDLTQEEFMRVEREFSDIFYVRVKCRKCGNIHEVHKACEVCDIETKVRR